MVKGWDIVIFPYVRMENKLEITPFSVPNPNPILQPVTLALTNPKMENSNMQLTVTTEWKITFTKGMS